MVKCFSATGRGRFVKIDSKMNAGKQRNSGGQTDAVCKVTLVGTFICPVFMWLLSCLMLPFFCLLVTLVEFSCCNYIFGH